MTGSEVAAIQLIRDFKKKFKIYFVYSRCTTPKNNFVHSLKHAQRADRPMTVHA